MTHSSLTAWTSSPLFVWEGAGQAMAAHLAAMHRQGQDGQLGSVVQRLAASFGLSANSEAVRKPPPKSVAPTFLTNPTRHEGGFFVADRVAYITVNGPLERKESWYSVGYDGLALRVETALADPMVDGAFLSIDSPGGHAAGMLECAGKIRASADKHNKPIVGHAPALVASAAYGVGVATDTLTIDPDAMCGSVGVVMLHADVSKMLDDFGVTLTAIKFGDKKTDGNFWEPISDRARSDLQTMIDDMGARFVAHVADRRGLSEQAVIDWQAGVLVGQRALDASMADSLATEGDAFTALLDSLNPTTIAPNPAGAGAQLHAPSTHTPEQQKDADMTLRAEIAAIMEGDGTAEEKNTATLALIAASDEPETEGEDDDASAATDEPAAEDEDENEDDDDGGPDAAIAGAIVTLPEAKGREKQAVKLAGTPGMTVKAAQSLLADAPKEKASKGLAARMDGQDPDITAGAPSKSENALLANIPPTKRKRA